MVFVAAVKLPTKTLATRGSGMRTTALRQRQGERQGLSLTRVHLLLFVFKEFFWSFFYLWLSFSGKVSMKSLPRVGRR